MPERHKLHPAAIVVYSADALRNAAFPLLAIFAVSVLGGGFDGEALVRAGIYGAIGITISALVGYVRWSSTTYWVTDTSIHHHTGIVREQDTNVPLARIEALDVHQGPLQRAFGVFAVDVQTGAGGKGGEISLPALTPGSVQRLREARPHTAAAETAPAGPRRKLSASALTVAAVTAGQLWILLPILAGAAQFSQQLFDRERGEEALSLLPDTWTGVLLVAAALLAAAWLLSALGTFVAFAGFTITRDGDRLRIRRGLVQRSEATVPVPRVRAVRVVEGVVRRPFGLASLTVEVTGYAEEQAAARTLFPLVRVRDVPGFLNELLPELADDPRGLERPPRRAARRYVLPGVVAGALVAAAAWVFIGYLGLVAPLAGALYGYAQWRSAGWRLSDGRLAVRALRIARTTVLAPAALRESHTLAQTVLQRRARLADLEVAFGKGTSARIRHLEAADARATWSAL
jgi:putative membrane protein